MFNNEIDYLWKNCGKRYEKKLDRPAIMMLMRAVVINYPTNNMIATKLSEVLPITEKLIVDYDRARENAENAFIVCILEDGREEAVKAPLTNPIIWNILKGFGEGN